ncbi:MAG: hypothetical protein MHPSP_000989 [Paramarteilia canceri]
MGQSWFMERIFNIFRNWSNKESLEEKTKNSISNFEMKTAVKKIINNLALDQCSLEQLTLDRCVGVKNIFQCIEEVTELKTCIDREKKDPKLRQRAKKMYIGYKKRFKETGERPDISPHSSILETLYKNESDHN